MTRLIKNYSPQQGLEEPKERVLQCLVIHLSGKVIKRISKAFLINRSLKKTSIEEIKNKPKNEKISIL